MFNIPRTIKDITFIMDSIYVGYAIMITFGATKLVHVQNSYAQHFHRA